MNQLETWLERHLNTLFLVLIAVVAASAFGGCWIAYETRCAAHFEQRVTQEMFGTHPGGI